METLSYLCGMERLIKLVLLNEVKDFIDALPRKVSDKIYYNIRRVMKGERNRELFKKLEDTDI